MVLHHAGDTAMLLRHPEMQLGASRATAPNLGRNRESSALHRSSGDHGLMSRIQ